MVYRLKVPSCPQAEQCVSLPWLPSECVRTYGRGDGARVRGDTLGGEVDTVGSLELDLKGSWAEVSARRWGSIDCSDLRQCGRNPC